MGRSHAAIRGLVIAGAVMLFLNPALVQDVGFQLSFFAVLGIVLFVPLFQKLFRGVPEYMGVRDILSMTFAAQVLTLPILMHSFGMVSLVSPLANLLIVPLIPFLLVFGFLFLLGGVLWGVLGFLLAIPLILLLTYMNGVVSMLSKIPYAAISVDSSLLQIVLFYSPVVLLLLVLRKRDIESQFF